MKFILALALTGCLFSCKEKEEAPSITPGLVGTYELSSTKPSYVFQDLLTGYDSFQETTTATISQTGTDTYRMQIQTIGKARKGVSIPVNYGFTADMIGGKTNYPIQLRFGFVGEYSNLIPSTPLLDKGSKYIECEAIPFERGIEVMVLIHYNKDRAGIVKSTLTKTK